MHHLVTLSRSSAWKQTHQPNVLLQALNMQETRFDGGKPTSRSVRLASGTPPISTRFESTSDLGTMLSPAIGSPAARTSSQSPRFSPTSRNSLTPSPPLEAPGKTPSQSIFSAQDFAAASNVEANQWVEGMVSPDQLETEGSSDQQQVSKRRKSFPKTVLTLPVSITERGTDLLPADGYAWRKYGQKDIQNSRHPRSYYRCTYRKELGCPATKHVQRLDDDPSLLCVTYNGVHTCHMSMQMQQICSRLPPDVAMPLPQWQTSTSEENSSFMVIDRGGQSQPGTYATFVTSSEGFEEPHITGSRDGPFNTSWRYNSPSVTTPAAAPKFGTDPISIREFQPVNQLLDETHHQSRPNEQYCASIMKHPSSANLRSGSDGYRAIAGWNTTLGNETTTHTSPEYSTRYHLESRSMQEFLAHETTSWSTDSCIEPTQRAVNDSQSNYLQRGSLNDLCAALPSLTQSISLSERNYFVRTITESPVELLEMPTRDREFAIEDQHHSSSFQTHYTPTITSAGEEQLCEVEDQAASSVLYDRN
ncbi:hypothetical protein O6H91_22G044100 [Diphasiastrum complanatum]|uniref:Uncharacterized protein n=1 Tax=Diphasiastrum complanatum TaxID=34168 RepID=A0ACC2AGT3_DIPCM|nr:hypothetical protein O6H91_22G044100 [Diphasiastrum complanatum]